MRFILRQICRYIFLKVMRAKKMCSHVYLVGNDKSLGQKDIFFYFPSYLLHLGDHFFWAPVINMLCDQGFRCSIYSDLRKSINFLYAAECVWIEDLDNICRETAMVTLFQGFADVNNKRFGTIIFIDQPRFSRVSLFRPLEYMDISDLLYNRGFRRIWQELPPVSLMLPRYTKGEPSAKVIQHVFNRNFVLFNPFHISSRYMIGKRKVNLLIKYAQKICDSLGCQLIVVGSTKDASERLELDTANIVDIRGKVSPNELIPLVNHELCLGTISFDTFLMHLSVYCGSRAFVMYRGRIGRVHHEDVQLSCIARGGKAARFVLEL